MDALLLLTDADEASADVLPALGLLQHQVRVAPADAARLLATGATVLADATAVLVDCRRDLSAARRLVRLLRAGGLDRPLLGVFTEGGLVAVTAEWELDDVLVDSAGPAEVEARIRLRAGQPETTTDVTRRGELVIDEAGYLARLGTRQLDLTFKEFELLKFLAQHEGRVFTRDQLLHEVWGYDYFGGTRTVDVHVRRLRAKLGPEHDQVIGTVRNVGYRFTPLPAANHPQPDAAVQR